MSLAFISPLKSYHVGKESLEESDSGNINSFLTLFHSLVLSQKTKSLKAFFQKKKKETKSLKLCFLLHCSREIFGEMHARVWWEENRARIHEQYL